MQLTCTGSECRDGARADVDQGSDRATIAVRETVRALSCSDVGVSYDVQVRLDAPLGDRELVDGACQVPRHARHTVCHQTTTVVEPLPA